MIGRIRWQLWMLCSRLRGCLLMHPAPIESGHHSKLKGQAQTSAVQIRH